MTGEQTQASTPGDAPVIRFVAGNPTDEEVAAIVAVVSARAAAGGSATTDAHEATYWGRPAHARYARPRSWAESSLPR